MPGNQGRTMEMHFAVESEWEDKANDASGVEMRGDVTGEGDAMKLLKLLVTKHGVKKARIQALDVEVDPSDMFRKPFG